MPNNHVSMTYLYITLSRGHCSFSNNELPKEDGRSPQDKGQDPRRCNHQPCHLGGPSCWIRQGFGDTEVSIKANDQQIHHRSI